MPFLSCAAAALPVFFLLLAIEDHFEARRFARAAAQIPGLVAAYLKTPMRVVRMRRAA